MRSDWRRATSFMRLRLMMMRLKVRWIIIAATRCIWNLRMYVRRRPRCPRNTRCINRAAMSWWSCRARILAFLPARRASRLRTMHWIRVASAMSTSSCSICRSFAAARLAKYRRAMHCTVRTARRLASSTRAFFSRSKMTMLLALFMNFTRFRRRFRTARLRFSLAMNLRQR